MSLDATRWAWLQKNLRPIQKLILLALADRADASDCAFPSYETLCEDTGADRKSVWAALKEMAELGIIQDTGQRKGATGKVAVWKLIGVAHRADVKSSQKRNDSKNGIVPFFPANGSKNGTVNGSENGTQNLSVEPTRETTSNTRVFLTAKDCPEGVPQDAWNELLAVRKKKRAELTARAWKEIAKQFALAKLTTEQGINTMLARGWQGFNAEWVQADPKQQAPQPRRNDWQARR